MLRGLSLRVGAVSGEKLASLAMFGLRLYVLHLMCDKHAVQRLLLFRTT
jgi:hypothetical protein